LRTAIKVTIILFIVGLVFTLLGSGWSQRPIIDYKMDGLEDNFTFHGYSMTVNLMYRNRGNIDASLKLVVTVTNANITVDSLEPWIEYNKTQVKFNVAAIAHMEAYSSDAVNIYPVGNPQNFTITYTIEDTSNALSINGIISHLFLEPHGYSPVYAVYNKTATDTYEWLKHITHP
jgi:hypothetical protein